MAVPQVVRAVARGLPGRTRFNTGASLEQDWQAPTRSWIGLQALQPDAAQMV